MTREEADLLAAMRSLERTMRRAAEGSTGPTAAVDYVPYAGRRMRGMQRPLSALGLEHMSEYLGVGRVIRVA